MRQEAGAMASVKNGLLTAPRESRKAERKAAKSAAQKEIRSGDKTI
jgi:hypothetical protein